MVNPTPKSPQEVEVLYILPAIRRDLSLRLKELGLEQKAIAKLLNVSEPAISQYMSSKRAAQVQFSTAMRKEIQETAKRIAESKTDAPIMHEIQRLVRRSLQEKITCGVCHGQVAGVPRGCDACMRS